MGEACINCSQLIETVDQSDDKTYGQIHELGTFENLNRSAATCPFCRFYLLAASAIDLVLPDTDICKFIYRPLGPGLLCGYLTREGLQLDGRIVSEDFYMLFEAVEICQHAPVVVSKSIHDRPIWQSGSMNMNDRLSLANQWLSDCINSHALCKATFAGSPARLLDLEGDENNAIIRLIDTASFPSLLPSYMTLSHCWGGSQPLKTTKQNLAAHLVGIDLKSMPKTFRDAVIVARRLGCRYLWIDSLCIVQDSREEWEKEAGTMAAIYLNSVLNISAVSASDCHGGCYIDARETKTVIAVSHSTRKRKYQIRIRKNPGKIDPEGLPGPLARRGWVLQEMVLAPRVLHFASDQMFWQCRELFNSEDGVAVAGKERDQRINSEIPEQRGFYWGHHRGSEAPRQPSRAPYWEVKAASTWQIWATDYSRRNLTYERDKLPAIAGIVQYHERETLDLSILGLWGSTFCWDLGWSTIPYDTKKGGIPSLPSWSWLSVRYRIFYHLFDGITVVDSHPENKLQIRKWAIQWSRSPYVSPIVSSQLLVSGHFMRFRPHGGISSYGPSLYPFTAPIPSRRGTIYYPDIHLTSLDGEGFNCLVLFTEKQTVYYLSLRPIAKLTVEMQRFRPYMRIGVGKFELEPDVDVRDFLKGWRTKTIELV